jgi:hypothetical protein
MSKQRVGAVSVLFTAFMYGGVIEYRVSLIPDSMPMERVSLE